MKSLTQIELANKVSVTWNQIPVNKRADQIKIWAEKLSEGLGLEGKDLETTSAENNLLSMVNYQLREAPPLIEKTELMPGPTGESNELYTSGRGTFLVTSNESAPIVAIIGLAVGALLAGNAVIFCLPQNKKELCNQIVDASLASGINEKTIQNADFSDINDLIENENIAGVAFAGDDVASLKINKQLAIRKGIIAQLIIENDFQEFTTLTDQYFIYRFITERTRTINVTAVGGNATLLALGSGDR